MFRGTGSLCSTGSALVHSELDGDGSDRPGMCSSEPGRSQKIKNKKKRAAIRPQSPIYLCYFVTYLVMSLVTVAELEKRLKAAKSAQGSAERRMGPLQQAVDAARAAVADAEQAKNAAANRFATARNYASAMKDYDRFLQLTKDAAARLPPAHAARAMSLFSGVSSLDADVAALCQEADEAHDQFLVKVKELECAQRELHAAMDKKKESRVKPTDAATKVRMLEADLASLKQLLDRSAYGDLREITLTDVPQARRRSDDRPVRDFAPVKPCELPAVLRHEFPKSLCAVDWTQLQNLVDEVASVGVVGLAPAKKDNYRDRAEVLRAIARHCADASDRKHLERTAKWLDDRCEIVGEEGFKHYDEFWSQNYSRPCLMPKRDAQDLSNAAKRWWWVLCDAYPHLFTPKNKRGADDGKKEPAPKREKADE